MRQAQLHAPLQQTSKRYHQEIARAERHQAWRLCTDERDRGRSRPADLIALVISCCGFNLLNSVVMTRCNHPHLPSAGTYDD